MKKFWAGPALRLQHVGNATSYAPDSTQHELCDWTHYQGTEEVYPMSVSAYHPPTLTVRVSIATRCQHCWGGGPEVNTLEQVFSDGHPCPGR